LAASSFVAVAPYLPDFLSLGSHRRPQTIPPLHSTERGDRERGIAAAAAIFSISCGSLPAPALAASDRGALRRLALRWLCDFSGTVRYAIMAVHVRRPDAEGGSRSAERSVVHLHLPRSSRRDDRVKLVSAWRDMVVRTWKSRSSRSAERAAARPVGDADLGSGKCAKPS
jgi:hypothetical protein